MQVTLLVTKEPTIGFKKSVLDVAIIPALANAAFAALVHEGLPLERTMVAALGIVGEDGEVVVEPTEKQLRGCKGVHATVWSMDGELMLAESAGKFSIEEWEDVTKELKEVALAAMASAGEDAAMEGGGVSLMEPWLRQKLEADVREANAWREIG